MISDLKNGVLFSALGKFSTVIISIVVNAILSRLLTPNDYGIVAIMQVFIVFFQMLVEAGMGPAIIQNKQLKRLEIGILFNYSIIFAILLSLGFGIFGRVISYVYENPIYTQLTWIQSIAVFFYGASIVPIATLNRDKRFKTVNLIRITANLLGGTIGIIAALNGLGVISLLMNSIVSSIIQFFGSLYLSKQQFVFSMSIKPLKEIYMFSINQFGFNFINYFTRNSDNLIIGKILGAGPLGAYSKAYQLIMMPNTVLLGIINPVLHPILSEYQDDVLYIKKIYLKIYHLLALIGVPLSIFMSLFSKEIITIIFGDQWSDAFFPFKILSLTIWIQMTLSSTGALFQARNKAKELFYTGLLSMIIIVSSILVGVLTWSLNGISVSLAIGFLVNYVVNYSMVMKLVLNSSLFDLLGELKTPFLIGIIEFIILFFTKQVILVDGPLILYFIAQALIFVVVFLVLTMHFDEKKKMLEFIQTND